MAPITAVRFSPNLLQPMRRFVLADGSVRYEVDASRPYVEIGSGSNFITLDTIGPVNDDGNPIPISDPIAVDSAAITQPIQVVPTGLLIDTAQVRLQLEGAVQYLAIEWDSDRLSDFLRTIAPNFAEQGSQGSSRVALRFVFGNPIKEARLDWAVSDRARTYNVPGLAVTTPSDAVYSLVLGFDDGGKPARLRFILTAEAKQEFIANSTFAWTRDNQRELQNDESKPTPDLFRFTATTQNLVSLVLLNFAFRGSDAPQFFRQLETPLTPLSFADADSLDQDLLVDSTVSL